MGEKAEQQATGNENAARDVDDDEADEVEIPDMEVIGTKVHIKAEIQASSHTDVEDEEPKLTESEAEEMEENKIEAANDEEEEEKKEDHPEKQEEDVAALTDA